MRAAISVLSVSLSLFLSLVVAAAADVPAKKTFQAGAYAINVSPLKFPVIVNGGMTERTADKITDPLHARCLVLSDGQTKVALVVVDSCMMPRDLLDEAKQMASRATGIPTAHMLISATHTHSAPGVHGCLGSDKDEDYARFLAPQIAKGIAEANSPSMRTTRPKVLGILVFPFGSAVFKSTFTSKTKAIVADSLQNPIRKLYCGLTDPSLASV